MKLNQTSRLLETVLSAITTEVLPELTNVDARQGLEKIQVICREFQSSRDGSLPAPSKKAELVRSPSKEVEHIKPAKVGNKWDMLRENFKDFLISHHGPLELTEFKFAPGGYGKETFFCTIRTSPDIEERLVIRKVQQTPAVVHSLFLLDQEYHFLRCLSQSGYPCPRPIAFGTGAGGPIGTNYYSMNRIPGAPIGSFFDSPDLVVSKGLIKQCAKLLADLHSTSHTNFTEYFAMCDRADVPRDTIEETYRVKVEGWRTYVSEVPHLESPLLTWLFHWLSNHLPSDHRPPVVVHGDFSLHNIMGRGEDVTGVLDWECADFGAPEQDLAYFRPFVTKYIDWAEFLDYYHESGGMPVREENLSFCLAYGAMKVVAGCARGALLWQEAITSEPRNVMAELGLTELMMRLALDTTVSADMEPSRLARVIDGMAAIENE